MSGLKQFKNIPETLREWSRWMSAQDIPDPVSDTILTGTAQFIGATPVAVTFITAEDSDDYAILPDAPVNETFWTTNKTVTGFRLNSSNGSSTALVKWVLVR